MLSRSSEAGGFESDSGHLTLTKADHGLKGTYLAYLTERFPADSTKPRHLVARGTFELVR